MARRSSLPGRLVPLAAVVAIAGCEAVPTSVLLRIEAPQALLQPERLVLSIFSGEGVDLTDHRLPPCPDPTAACPAPTRLPANVVLYPRQTGGQLRLLVRSLEANGAAVLAEGTSTVTLQQGQQVRASVLLTAGRLPDQDGDGVPDRVDNCPARPNPDQGPCVGPDAGADGPRADGPLADLPPLHDARDSAPPPDVIAPDAPAVDQGPPSDTAPVCSCALGCKPGSSGCRQLIPSNGYTVPSSGYVSIGAITGAVVINTSSCQLKPGGTPLKGTIQTASGVTACVFALKTLAVKSGATLSVEGADPLVLLVETSVTVAGGLDVGAKGAVSGPGGGAGGVPALSGSGVKGGGPGGGFVCGCGSAGSQDDCGGGGAGHGTMGGVGGSDGAGCSTLSAGGPITGSPSLSPLSAGSGGASADQRAGDPPNGAGGAGGGALQISCQGAITVTGWISAGGGGGLTGAYLMTNPGGIAGGGGGSGGGVLLEGASIGGKGVVAANGGGGAGASYFPGGACHGQGSAGHNGAATMTAAKGGAAGASGCGRGGNGGYQTAQPKEGQSSFRGGGGGGGAAGRVRYSWYKHTSSLPITKTSAVASTGEAKVQ